MDIEVANRASAVRTRSLIHRIIQELGAHEFFMLLFAAFFVVVALAAHSVVREWPQVLYRMLGVSIAIAIVNWWSSAKEGRRESAFKTFYIIPLVPIYFKTAEFISHSLHGRDYDSLLIAADRMLFGVNPTQWLAQHFPTWPALTEYLMICYSLFYFLPIAVAIELYVRAKKSERMQAESSDREQLRKILFIIVYGFLLSYASYFLLPSIGPRFTVHDFFNLSRELPGLWVTDGIRSLLNRGENIQPWMGMQDILRCVTRDAFPSGHADITLLSILLAFEFKTRVRWPIAIIGSSLIFATVYLRYHYVIDVIGGVVLAIVTLYTWEWVRDRMIDLKARLMVR